MHFLPNRLALFFAMLLLAALPAGAGVVPQVTGTSVPPVFLTGTSETDLNPYYNQPAFNTLPVGKTVVVPIVVSGSGPMTYSATSNSPALAPLIKTGYPVMTVKVTYSGTSSLASKPSTLYPFTGGSDGGGPYAGLLVGADGNLYGTTSTGTNGAGTVFQLTTTGALTTIHSFSPLSGGTNADGANPYAALIQTASGDLIGTTGSGGAYGAGTVFQTTTSGSLTTLYSFTGGADGGNPYGGVVTGTDGNFYGTTGRGGTGGAGTVFQLATSGSLNTLHSFTGGNDGGDPQAGLIVGSDGNLYGTTVRGGANNAGTVFQITTSGSLTTFYSFTGGSDGKSPYGGLLAAGPGVFYGTTETGGTNSTGVMFQVTTSGSLTTIHTFDALSSGTNADGASPYAGLTYGSNGNLFGTTEAGGAGGAGTVFEFSGGSLSTLYSFSALSSGTNADGANPFAGLTSGTSGNLYGTTTSGGAHGLGAVFEIASSGSPSFSGTMTFALLRDMAPITTGYIAGFAQAGYYNDHDFFRITNLAASGQHAAFIAQGGDPTETGTGTPGFSFDNELSPSLIFTGQGQLAMANAGINQSTYRGTNGSQFFITQNPIRSLDFGYTIFGQLIQGFDTMQKIMGVPLESNGSSPTVPVVMNSVTVSEDNTDAILLVNAAGAVPGGATITVKAADPAGHKAVVLSGTTATPDLTLGIATFDDTVNDPPILDPVPNITAGLDQSVSIPFKSHDLEFDYLASGAQALANSTGAKLSVTRSVATITPNRYSPLGSVTAGLYVYEPFISGNPESQTGVTVGLGTGKLTAVTPAFFLAAPNNTLVSSTAGSSGGAPVIGSFLDSNPGGSPGNFIATINWGDGTTIASGTGAVTVSKSPYLPTTYEVTATQDHSYANPGIYPVHVTVTNTGGGILEMQNTAVVSPGPIYACGRAFTAASGSFDGLVATFVNNTAGVIAADYEAVINWGDGSVTTGTIRGSGSSFKVYGAHKYTAGTTYPVDVTVNSLINGDSAYAWSIAKLSGVPTRQPPFAQSHVIGELSSAGYGPGYLDEQVTLINSGNLPSPPVTLKFYLYLSNTAPTVAQLSANPPVPSGAIPMKIGRNDTYNTPFISPGSAISGLVSDILLPYTGGRTGYIIMQVIAPDPIGSHMDYQRAFFISE